MKTETKSALLGSMITGILMILATMIAAHNQSTLFIEQIDHQFKSKYWSKISNDLKLIRTETPLITIERLNPLRHNIGGIEIILETFISSSQEDPSKIQFKIQKNYREIQEKFWIDCYIYDYYKILFDSFISKGYFEESTFRNFPKLISDISEKTNLKDLNLVERMDFIAERFKASSNSSKCILKKVNIDDINNNSIVTKGQKHLLNRWIVDDGNIIFSGDSTDGSTIVEEVPIGNGSFIDIFLASDFESHLIYFLNELQINMLN